MFDQVPEGKVNDLCSFSSKPLWILNMLCTKSRWIIRKTLQFRLLMLLKSLEDEPTYIVTDENNLG